jgi:hypothetical protein
VQRSGQIDIFAFIGTNKVADELQKAHPFPHRLKVCLGQCSAPAPARQRRTRATRRVG